MKIASVAVVGAGNMGSGIAQKIAAEGVPVVLVDSTRERAEAGKQKIEALLREGVARKLFTEESVRATLGRITPTGNLEDVRAVDLVIEAVFEDLDVKRQLFARLGEVTRPETLLATNTSSFLVADLAPVTKRPERLIGLHYFYHPAKNRLVEVIGHAGSSEAGLRAAWAFQERVGKTPIASRDAAGFVVNRFFVPWLNEAVRLHEEGHSIASIEAAAKASFGVGMGPFELMNVTGVPITLHASTSLGERLGAFYAPAKSLAPKVKEGTPWDLGGAPDAARAREITDRLWGVVFHVAMALVSEGVGSVEDTDVGAKVGLRWPRGPFETANALGVGKALELAAMVQQRYALPAPRLMQEHQSGKPFRVDIVRAEVRERVATLTINRPDQLNALDPDTVRELAARFAEVERRSDVDAIVLAGAGKAFVAGADVKFFVDRIKAGKNDEIVQFARTASQLFRDIERSKKLVVCRLDGLALGGGGELVLACHVVVATPKASMSFPETGIGIYPGLGGTQRLARRLGAELARVIIQGGIELTAEELAAVSLADRVVPADAMDEALRAVIAQPPPRQPAARPDRIPARLAVLAEGMRLLGLDALRKGAVGAADPAVADLAKKVSRKAPLALAAADNLIGLAARVDLDAGLAAELEGLANIFASKDALEGLSSVLEKRRPAFSGG